MKIFAEAIMTYLLTPQLLQGPGRGRRYELSLPATLPNGAGHLTHFLPTRRLSATTIRYTLRLRVEWWGATQVRPTRFYSDMCLKQKIGIGPIHTSAPGYIRQCLSGMVFRVRLPSVFGIFPKTRLILITLFEHRVLRQPSSSRLSRTSSPA